MISDVALKRIARQQGINVEWVEKDYMISWFLKALYENDCLKEALVFKGGTALKKVYFPETWRLSYDLDFTDVVGLDAEKVRACLEEVFYSIAGESGLTLRLDSLRAVRGGLDAKIQFTGPLAHKNQLSLDIMFGEKLALDPEWATARTAYPDVPSIRVKVYSLKEILVEKIRSIMQRGKSRDYFDVWKLLQENEFDMVEVKALLIRKCEIRGIEYEPDLFFDAERLGEAERYWRSALVDLVRVLPKFEDVVASLRVKLKVLG